MVQESKVAAADARDEELSELDAPIWSVVSFDKRESSGSTYRAAREKLAELESKNVPGLCIITDEAASRMSG